MNLSVEYKAQGVQSFTNDNAFCQFIFFAPRCLSNFLQIFEMTFFIIFFSEFYYQQNSPKFCMIRKKKRRKNLRRKAKITGYLRN